MCHLYPRVPNFTPFRSTSNRFRDTGHFEKSAPNDLKMTRNTTRSKVPHKVKGTPYVWLVSIRLKFQSFSHYGQPFLSYRPFWEKCTQMTLKCIWANVPHITSVPEFHVSLRFALWPAVLELPAIWRLVHRITLYDLEPYKVKCTP